MGVNDLDESGLSKLSRSPGADRAWVLCWCGAEVLAVPAELVRCCRTESCGSLWCSPPDRLWEAP